MAVYRTSHLINHQKFYGGDVLIADKTPISDWLLLCGNCSILDIQGKEVGTYSPQDDVTGARVKYTNQPFIYGGIK